MPVQPNDYDCGYYVMRYMHDIVNLGSENMTIPKVMLYLIVFQTLFLGSQIKSIRYN